MHGHSHFTAEATEEFLIAKTLNEKGYNLQIYNVGCMYWNYVPVTLDEILKTKDQRICICFGTTDIGFIFPEERIV